MVRNFPKKSSGPSAGIGNLIASLKEIRPARVDYPRIVYGFLDYVIKNLSERDLIESTISPKGLSNIFGFCLLDVERSLEKEERKILGLEGINEDWYDALRNQYIPEILQRITVPELPRFGIHAAEDYKEIRGL